MNTLTQVSDHHCTLTTIVLYYYFMLIWTDTVYYLTNTLFLLFSTFFYIFFLLVGNGKVHLFGDVLWQLWNVRPRQQIRRERKQIQKHLVPVVDGRAQVLVPRWSASADLHADDALHHGEMLMAPLYKVEIEFGEEHEDLVGEVEQRFLPRGVGWVRKEERRGEREEKWTRSDDDQVVIMTRSCQDHVKIMTGSCQDHTIHIQNHFNIT